MEEVNEPTDDGATRDYAEFKCFACNTMGHIARFCPTVPWEGGKRGRGYFRPGRWVGDRGGYRGRGGTFRGRGYNPMAHYPMINFQLPYYNNAQMDSPNAVEGQPAHQMNPNASVYVPDMTPGNAPKSATPGASRGNIPNRKLKFDEETQQEGQLEAIVRSIQKPPVEKQDVVNQLSPVSSEREKIQEVGTEYPTVLSDPMTTFPLGIQKEVLPRKKMFGPQLEKPNLPLK